MTFARLACGLDISRIGLGSDRLHHVVSAQDRRCLVATALEIGVTHFDTAPFYGDGMTERLMGELLRGHRSEVTIATKFGLLPNRLIGSLGNAGLPFRVVRSVLRKARLLEFPRKSFDLERMCKSLELSLRALRTDYVDIFFVHEPRLADMSAALLDALHDLKKKGMARFVGIAGSECSPIVASYGSQIDVVQTAESEWSKGGFTPDITYGIAEADASPEKSRAMKVRAALGRRPSGAVLVGTTKASRLREMVAL